MDTRLGIENVRASLARMTGDEKHDESSHLDAGRAVGALRPRAARRSGEPDGSDRDRFILSKGHGPAAFYAVLAAKGFFPEHELDGFLTWGSGLGSHPDRRQVPGVEASTGSLGHGLPLAVGVALALRAKGRTDRRVVVLCGDAELNEGSNWEAILLAPHLQPGRPHAPRDRQPQLVDRDGAVGGSGSARSGGTWPWSAGTIVRRSPRRSRAGRAGRTPSSPTSRRASGDGHADAAGGDRDRLCSSAIPGPPSCSPRSASIGSNAPSPSRRPA